MDTGKPRLRGVALYEAQKNRYVVSGGGANIWAQSDAFHFLQRPGSGDLFLEAKVSWLGAGGNPHRKAGLMMRADQSADAPYVDLMLHGDGLIAMQFRRKVGSATEEIRAASGGERTMQLERHGSLFSAQLIDSSGQLQSVGSFELDLPDTLLFGLAVCAHDDQRLETAYFNSTAVRSTPKSAIPNRIIESTLEIYDLQTRMRRIVYRAARHFEAPNWLGDRLIFNSGGRLFSVPVGGGEPQPFDTGFADRCNNDHGFSADGRWLAVSHDYRGGSHIFILPAAGGVPRLLTPKGPSYWHGWSPDGTTLAYCAQRNKEYDVYTIPFSGGDEKRLTNQQGLDDGPEYSADGRYIYFNSVRTGVMKIWRMRPDGSLQEQVTFNEAYADWFAHPSPDGKWIIFISYDKNVEGHPANKNVFLRLMPASGGETSVIATFFGGQGSLNVPSWSPDSRQFAFVSYRLIPGK